MMLARRVAIAMKLKRKRPGRVRCLLMIAEMMRLGDMRLLGRGVGDVGWNGERPLIDILVKRDGRLADSAK